MSDNIRKEYSNEDITVVWQPKLCIHSSKCWKGLNEVFNPKEKPWINMSGSNSKNIIHQVKQCPSGALSFYLNEHSEETETAAEVNSRSIKVMKNGPLIVDQGIVIELANGDKIENNGPSALCRCGASNNKPFCDGTHKKIMFEA